MSRANPFAGDADRAAIWEMLVPRDIEAVLAADWGRVAGDFVEDGFTGIAGAAHPDDWRVAYPTLAAYRDDWLAQGAKFNALFFRGETGADFLWRANRIDAIEITGDRAIAHKKFKAVGALAGGGDYSFDWQTLYVLRRLTEGWRITGFVGYLPHPFPAPPAAARAGNFAVEGASQHATAGPYSPALTVVPATIVAISGQGPLDKSGAIVGAGIAEQTRVTLENCAAQLASAGASLADVFQARVYLARMEDWDAFNAVYRTFMHEPYPVRTAIQARLWGGMLVEVDMLANRVAP